MLLNIDRVIVNRVRLYKNRSTVQGQTITGNWMWKPISLVNLIYKVFVSDGMTGHLRKVCNNIYTNIFL